MPRGQTNPRPSVREQLIANAMSSCVHYRGTARSETCAAGVNYRQLAGGPDFGWATRLPCHKVFEKDGVEPSACEHLKFLTREEAEASADASEKRWAEVSTALLAVKADATERGYRKGHGGYGEIACPICTSGRLAYSFAGYNKHIHGKCSTEGCVSWMQ